MSLLPSPLKSPVPAIDQPLGSGSNPGSSHLRAVHESDPHIAAAVKRPI
jgi:hypothetical protein